MLKNECIEFLQVFKLNAKNKKINVISFYKYYSEIDYLVNIDLYTDYLSVNLTKISFTYINDNFYDKILTNFNNNEIQCCETLFGIGNIKFNILNIYDLTKLLLLLDPNKARDILIKYILN